MKTLTVPCAECEGRGKWHGYLTNNPSERADWHFCWECNGTGVARTIEIPEDEILDERM